MKIVCSICSESLCGNSGYFEEAGQPTPTAIPVNLQNGHVHGHGHGTVFLLRMGPPATSSMTSGRGHPRPCGPKPKLGFVSTGSPTEICATPCGHVFHTICLETWFRAQVNRRPSMGRCPNCNAEFKMLMVRRIFLDEHPEPVIPKAISSASSQTEIVATIPPEPERPQTENNRKRRSPLSPRQIPGTSKLPDPLLCSNCSKASRGHDNENRPILKVAKAGNNKERTSSSVNLIELESSSSTGESEEGENGASQDMEVDLPTLHATLISDYQELLGQYLALKEKDDIRRAVLSSLERNPQETDQWMQRRRSRSSRNLADYPTTENQENENEAGPSRKKRKGP